jgi:hypothetical protein
LSKIRKPKKRHNNACHPNTGDLNHVNTSTRQEMKVVNLDRRLMIRSEILPLLGRCPRAEISVLPATPVGGNMAKQKIIPHLVRWSGSPTTIKGLYEGGGGGRRRRRRRRRRRGRTRFPEGNFEGIHARRFCDGLRAGRGSGTRVDGSLINFGTCLTACTMNE